MKDSIATKPFKFRFFPTRFTWAAIHPRPIGVVYFIGGAFFGSFPTLFYRFLLKSLFYRGYTVIALPFRFSLRHWSIALSLLENQDDIRREIQEEAQKQGFETVLYEQEAKINTAKIKEYWMGHSLGCKYIALMELLTDFEIFDKQNALIQCLGPQQAERISTQIDKSSLASISLYNQPSILLDPVISDLDSAVPIKPLQRLLSRLIQVLPSRQETFCLVRNSNLFALTSIIAFNSRVAEDSIVKLKQILKKTLLDFRSVPVEKSRLGNHLAPLGVSSGNQAIVEAVYDELEKSRKR
ncbi:conserved hypothetical protein [Synechococcus sp. PCC 7335]|uniref:DUF1350 family protein n=1 Tax=Synechococcus sp. (strain ATCC 29403 / PCC 7335) TaxID=91464 RepID=UPI00017EB08E|nr:DUF1350 family protein [Synechococcus sp. PCC 7335]EDX84783.1 conserved hypothetical protein [Synechococcus sp. PCC 7335]